MLQVHNEQYLFQLIGTEREANNEIQKKIQSSAATMNQLKIRIDNMVRTRIFVLFF